MKLSPSFVEGTLPAGRHSDGRNLYLSVSKTGSKSWVFMWMQNGRQRELGLGSFTGAGRASSVSLKQARLKADAVRGQIAMGIDPVAAKQALVMAATTFKTLMEEHIANLTATAGWKVRDGVCDQEVEWTRSLTQHAAKLLDKPVGQISDDLVVSVLKPIWKEIPVTAERIRYRIEQVMALAISKGAVSGVNPARYDGHIELRVGKRPGKKITNDQRHASMPHADIPAFMAKLLRQQGMAAKALAFVTLTAVRTDEARLAQWSEFDLDAGVWTIPASRMKVTNGGDHLVPLSTTAIELLRTMPRDINNPFVFFGKKEGAALGATALADKLCDPVKKGGMGYKDVATVHGMRASFRGWAGSKGFARDLCEEALAHSLGATEAAYNREQRVELRRVMMQAWADHCEGKSNVVALKVAA